MPNTHLLTVFHYRVRRLADWLRNQVRFSWLDTLDSDYRDWKPEGPIYERLIR